MVNQIIWIYSLVSVIIVSLISLVGVFTLSVKTDRFRKIVIYLVSFSAGALLGDVFFHLLPEVWDKNGVSVQISGAILAGIVMFFVLEKFIHWQHCHGSAIDENHVHAFAKMNLVGDGFHNFLDGLIIGTSYLVSIPVGIATSLAVVFHEIPQEIGDYGVLIHGGYSKGRALLLNFASALLAVLGTLLALIFSGAIENLELIIVPVIAGGFIYIAGSDLIPELHKHSNRFKDSIVQLIAFILGILVMFGLLFLGV
jgi:zinc and cadmium transporter